MSATQTFAPHRRQRSARSQVLLSTIFVFVVIVFIGAVLFIRSRTLIEDNLRERLRTLTDVAAMQFRAEDIEAVHGPEDMEKPEFTRLVTELQRVRYAIPNAAFTYILRKTERPIGIAFVADADALRTESELDVNKNGVVDPEEEGSYPGDWYDASQAPALMQGFYTATVDPGVTHDQWGDLISGYAPIHDANGLTVGLLGVDIRSQDFSAVVRGFFPPSALALFGGGAILLVLYTGLLSWRNWEEHRRLQTLLRNLPGMAYRRRNDAKWTLDFVSEGCCDLIGHDPCDLVNMRTVSYTALIHPDDRETVWGQVQAALRERRPFLVTYRIADAKGQEKWVWERGMGVYHADGDLAAIEGFVMDITEQKRLDITRNDFLRAASHQLRTPISSLRWSLSTLADSEEQKLVGMQKEIVADAQKAVVRMSQTIDGMLHVSELESKHTDVERAMITLADVIEEARRNVQTEADKRKQTIAVKLEGLPQIRSDATLLKEVFQALLHNAVVYSPEGAAIGVRGSVDDTSVKIDIVDSGCGIPLHQQSRVFTKFFRAENAATHWPDGSGLGLSLAQSLLQMLGGSIGFASEENKGSTFTVTFPKRQAA